MRPASSASRSAWTSRRTSVRSRIVAKKSGTVVLQEPVKRRGVADPGAVGYARLIDAAHALMIVVSEDGVRGAERWLKRTGLRTDGRFQGLLQALLNAIPRTKAKGGVRPTGSGGPG
ncbi:MAG: hypothetical protein KatS3mg014_1252 [Actinomycetota bacterium]|nr:MAG: hypothetical protein KatS3mg014_1252 [Actinomycetota bacterium]